MVKSPIDFSIPSTISSTNSSLTMVRMVLLLGLEPERRSLKLANIGISFDTILPIPTESIIVAPLTPNSKKRVRISSKNSVLFKTMMKSLRFSFTGGFPLSA